MKLAEDSEGNGRWKRWVGVGVEGVKEGRDRGKRGGTLGREIHHGLVDAKGGSRGWRALNLCACVCVLTWNCAWIHTKRIRAELTLLPESPYDPGGQGDPSQIKAPGQEEANLCCISAARRRP